jgi:hypothetical protein
MNLSTSILRSTSPVLFAAMSLYGLGCIADPSEMGPSEEERIAEARQGVAGDPGTQNHLRPTVLTNHGVQHTTRAIGNGALVNASNQLPSMPYMPTANATGDLAGARVEYLEVLVGCALPEGVSVTDPSHTVFYFNGSAIKKTYHGEIGLAPDWKTRGLTLVEKKWVTACVLARTNRYGVTLDILLSGNHSAITHRSPGEYTEDESKAWGNMFDSTISLSTTNPNVSPNAIPFEAYICSEISWCADQQAATTRSCDSEYTPCGFSYMQDCADFFAFCNEPTNLNFPACWGRLYAIQASLKASDATCP